MAILDFFEVAPRLNLKVRSQGIIMPKMALVSTMVTIVTLSHQTMIDNCMIVKKKTVLSLEFCFRVSVTVHRDLLTVYCSVQ